MDIKDVELVVHSQKYTVSNQCCVRFNIVSALEKASSQCCQEMQTGSVLYPKVVSVGLIQCCTVTYSIVSISFLQD